MGQIQDGRSIAKQKSHRPSRQHGWGFYRSSRRSLFPDHSTTLYSKLELTSLRFSRDWSGVQRDAGAVWKEGPDSPVTVTTPSRRAFQMSVSNCGQWVIMVVVDTTLARETTDSRFSDCFWVESVGQDLSLALFFALWLLLNQFANGNRCRSLLRLPCPHLRAAFDGGLGMDEL